MQTRSPFLVSLAVVSVVAVTASAKDFWEKKPYGEWNEKEVQRLLSASPWANSIPMQLKDTEARDANAYQAGVDSASRFGAGKDTHFNKTTLTLVWNGRPVRMAQVRQRQLAGQAADAAKDAEFIAGPDPDYYVFVLQARGFPGIKAETAESLEEKTHLTVGKKDGRVIAPERVELPEGGGGEVAVFFFPKGEQPITVDEGTVMFDSKMGDYDVSTGFELSAMVFEGNLEL